MNPMIQDKLKDLVDLCRKRGVRRLALFGSTTGDHFDPTRSDVDLVVEFVPLSPVEHANSYFGLMEDLQRLFAMPVDLIEPGPIHNPYFRQVLEKTQVVLYEAA